MLKSKCHLGTRFSTTHHKKYSDIQVQIRTIGGIIVLMKYRILETFFVSEFKNGVQQVFCPTSQLFSNILFVRWVSTNKYISYSNERFKIMIKRRCVYQGIIIKFLRYKHGSSRYAASSFTLKIHLSAEH